MSTRILSWWVLLLLVAAAEAQELVWRIGGTAGARRIGRQIVPIGDLNQDGYEDLATIVTGACGQGNGFDGHLWLLSGNDGTLIREVSLPSLVDTFGSVGRAGDWDDDGIADYVVGAGYNLIGLGQVEVRSGRTDTILQAVAANYSEVVIADVDLDGDGHEDLIVGDEHPFGYLGELRAWNHSGTLLYHLIGDLSANPPLSIAVCAAKLGDIDDDGCDDFVMECFEPTGRGASVVVSGRKGDYIQICYGELPGDALCQSVDACGDIDGDGYSDFVVGNGGGWNVARGVCAIFSSRTGQRLQQWTAVPNSEFGFSVASRGVDFDGDSVPDVVTGGIVPTDRILAFSGRDGSTLQQWPAAQLPAPAVALWQWKTAIQPPGQHTGWIIAAEVNSGSGCGMSLGSVSAYRGVPRTTEFAGVPCAGNLPAGPLIGLQSLGTAGVRVPLSGAPPNVPALLLVGATWISNPGVQLPFALGAYGWPGCSLHTSIVVTQPVVTGTLGIDAGYEFVDLPWPVRLVGGNPADMVSAQWLVLGDASTWPGGLSQAVKWRF